MASRSHERCFGAVHPVNGDARHHRVRALPCLIAGVRGHCCNSRIQAAHVIARGMGGANGSRRDQVPACALAHEQMGEHPSMYFCSTPELYAGTKRGKFELDYGVDVIAIAEGIAEHLDEEGYP